ncbi:MAG: hypothetical protein JWP97_3710 [Labilithrix sp.]|nr:hypothetical protein [Labilithrix sp.]
MSFRIRALSAALFAPLFDLSDAALAERGAVRVVVSHPHATPCRVSLEDAPVGETVILTHFEHQPARSPFRASHAIYVRPHVEAPQLADGEIPAMLRRRLLSVRAFDDVGMMVAADVADGTAVDALIETMLKAPATDYLHVHFARQGCYAARVERSS